MAHHRASLSSELGSIWDFIRIDRDRRRSEPATYEPIDSKSPARLARDLLQVVQETVFKKFEEPKKCPLVKEESDLTESDEDDGTERRVANLIDFFFTIVKSQKEGRKGSGGSCFRSEISPTDDKLNVYAPSKVNTELEQKMETLMEFLATTGCMDEEIVKDDKKITLMEFLFGSDDRKVEKPVIEVTNDLSFTKGISLSESNVNVKNLCFIDETPDEENDETLVDMLLKYMENYSSSDLKEKYKEPIKSMSMTPSLSEKSKSDITISRLETFSDMSKTKSDSTLTQTQDTVIDRFEDMRSEKSPNSRRISETVVDLSNVKQDLESIFEDAVAKICEIRRIHDDTMSEQEDIENFNAYTKPSIQYVQYLPYSVELSDIIEEDELSYDRTSQDDRAYVRTLAEEVLRYIEDRIQIEDSDTEDEFDYEMKRSSISLIDLRNIPDLPESMIIKPKVVKVDKSTSTTEISDSISDMSKRIDSGCMTEDTSLTSEWSDKALNKLESLHKFFSKSRLEIIDESLEENGIRTPKTPKVFNDEKANDKGQASLDDVEDILDDSDEKITDDKVSELNDESVDENVDSGNVDK